MSAPDYAFKVTTPDGHDYEISADGDIKGFPEGSIVFNRLPATISRAVMEAMNRVREATSA